ncbi:hypothetical protein TcWFU_008289 [Taenia crassiceps]|uniref:Uncharacterized protein n=1 Tax=Taenia crassiceps TaxID=6207 RepID=A0ABR4Q0C6_9CEST
MKLRQSVVERTEGTEGEVEEMRRQGRINVEFGGEEEERSILSRLVADPSSTSYPQGLLAEAMWLLNSASKPAFKTCLTDVDTVATRIKQQYWTLSHAIRFQTQHTKTSICKSSFHANKWQWGGVRRSDRFKATANYGGAFAVWNVDCRINGGGTVDVVNAVESRQGGEPLDQLACRRMDVILLAAVRNQINTASYNPSIALCDPTKHAFITHVAGRHRRLDLRPDQMTSQMVLQYCLAAFIGV